MHEWTKICNLMMLNRCVSLILEQKLKLGFVSSGLLSRYRKHAFLFIMLVAAVITPPDLMTLVLVAIPLYVLYEVSIRVARWVE